MPRDPLRRKFLKALAALPLFMNVHSVTPHDIKLAARAVREVKESPRPRIVEVLEPDSLTRIIGVIHSPIPGDPAEEGLGADVREELRRFEEKVGKRPRLALEYFPVYGTQLLKEYGGWMEPNLSPLTQKRVQGLGLLTFLGMSLGKEVLKEEISKREFLNRIYDLLRGVGLWTALQATHFPYPAVHTWREIQFARRIDELREKGPVVGIFGAFHTQNVYRYLTDPRYRKIMDFLYPRL